MSAPINIAPELDQYSLQIITKQAAALGLDPATVAARLVRDGLAAQRGDGYGLVRKAQRSRFWTGGLG